MLSKFDVNLLYLNHLIIFRKSVLTVSFKVVQEFAKYKKTITSAKQNTYLAFEIISNKVFLINERNGI